MRGPIRLPFRSHARSGSIPYGRFRTGPLARNRARDAWSSGLRWGHRTTARLAPLAAGILFALIAVNAHANPCDDAKANELFVDAAIAVHGPDADRLSQAKKLEVRQNALRGLNLILASHSCTKLAVRLASGQSIGNISIAGLRREIAILEKEIPECCRCTPLHDALISAMDIREPEVRDDIVATVARKLARRGDFKCAQDVVDLIDDDKEKNLLHQHLARAEARAALTKRRCCLWPWQ